MAWTLLLDIFVAGLLMGTIYFVYRLSEQLARFRQNRQEMERVTRDLNAVIERANLAIAGMRAAAETSGHDLQKATRQATELSDELQLMIESGHALANRLEKAATAHSASSSVPVGELPRMVVQPIHPVSAASLSRDEGGFVLRDRDFNRDDDRLPQENEDDLMDGDVSSEAERELIRALENRARGR